jgi:hypothetical protein
MGWNIYTYLSMYIHNTYTYMHMHIRGYVWYLGGLLDGVGLELGHGDERVNRLDDAVRDVVLSSKKHTHRAYAMLSYGSRGRDSTVDTAATTPLQL